MISGLLNTDVCRPNPLTKSPVDDGVATVFSPLTNYVNTRGSHGANRLLDGKFVIRSSRERNSILLKGGLMIG